MVELLVFAVTGFAVSLAAWFLFDALPGKQVRFERKTLAEYGLFHSGVAFAFAGPVMALENVVSQSSSLMRFAAGLAISLLWSVALGMTVIGLILSI